VSKMLWSMVSKAAERLRRHRHGNFCDPIALMRECIGGLFIIGTGAEVSWVRSVCTPEVVHHLTEDAVCMFLFLPCSAEAIC